MSKRIYINVTAADIKNGQRMQSDRCPVALAAKRTHGHTIVGAGTIATDEGRGYLPERAYTFIRNFDLGRKVEPFRFNVRVK